MGRTGDKYERHARLGMRAVYFTLTAFGFMAFVLFLVFSKKDEPFVCGVIDMPHAVIDPGSAYQSMTAGVDGEKLFKQNCAVCHSLGPNVLTGPGLKGIEQRIPSRKWAFEWVKNAEKMKKTDAYAQKIDKDFPSANMTSFEFLSDDEVTEILRFIGVDYHEEVKDPRGK